MKRNRRADVRGVMRTEKCLALAGLMALSAVSCIGDGSLATRDGGDAPVVLAEFEARGAVAEGRLEIAGFRLTEAGGRAIELRNPDPGEHDLIDVVQDGVAGSGPPDTVELSTVAGTVGAGFAACGRENSFCGDVRLTSFFAAAELRGVFVELFQMVPPAGNTAFGDFPGGAGSAQALGLSDSLGLWDYGNLGPLGSTVRRWKFDNFTGTDFFFRGVVKGEVVAAAGPLEETCGNGSDDDLDLKTDCVDPDCSDDPACNGGVEICGNGHDDDQNGEIDCADAGCAASPACGQGCVAVVAQAPVTDVGVSSQDFEPALDGRDAFAADDFDVEAGGIVFDRLRIDGHPSSWPLSAATAFEVAIYADGGGRPAGYPVYDGTAPVWHGRYVPGTPGLELADGGATAVVTPAAAVTLPAGRYWLVAHAEMGSSGGWWYRALSGGGGGGVAVGINPGNGWGFGSDWFGIQTVTRADRSDLAFSLERCGS